MGRIFSFLVMMMVVGGVGQLFWGDPDPDFRVEIAEDDAFTLAALILGQGGVRGCGSFRVIGQRPNLQRIEVECGRGPGARVHRLTYLPNFRIDGDPLPKDSWREVMEAPRLTRIFCTQRPDGAWDLAFLRERDAGRRASVLSTELGQPVRVQYGFEGSWSETEQREDGSWGDSRTAWEHDPDGHAPDGCRL